MSHSERIAPIAAVLSALMSITCCLPLSIPAAIGLAGFGVVLSSLQPWFIGVSLVLLVLGFLQLWRGRSCRRPSTMSIVFLCLATVMVLALALLPQVVANFLADPNWGITVSRTFPGDTKRAF
jgi:hypothetical protein